MRVALLVNGLGLGNSTRCHALVERLHERGCSIQIVTSGNGLWYFRGRPEVSALHEVESLHYSAKHGRISIVRTLGSLASLAGVLRRNARRVSDLLDGWRPDVVVTDSDYTIWPMKRRRIPVAALNNSDVVHCAYRMFPDRPSSIRAQFYAVEEWDYRFHRVFPTLAVSPTLDRRIPSAAARFHRVDPIVRRGYTSEPRAGRTGRAVVMLSGSVFGTPVNLRHESYPVHIDVIGREAPADWPGSRYVTYHGKLRDNLELLRAADLIVVNGGFSAVSEAFAMRKPMVVVPVPRHAEQWLNARTIVHLGVGTIAKEEELEGAMLAALDRVDEFRAAYERLPVLQDGAADAAELIMGLAGRDARA
jgi:UDP:flavonoid glycosyltransferase YjiC (YdhE family)